VEPEATTAVLRRRGLGFRSYWVERWVLKEACTDDSRTVASVASLASIAVVVFVAFVMLSIAAPYQAGLSTVVAPTFRYSTDRVTLTVVPFPVVAV
jgi:hypothetical protein